MPSKTSYYSGETISYNGLVVSATYDDGTKHDVTAWCDFSPPDGSAMPENDVTVTVSCAPPVAPTIYDLNYGYIDSSDWKYENPTKTYIDVYEVQAGHKYYITLGATVGSRFQAMFTTLDISQSRADVTGTRIINQNNPSTYANATYTPSSNGYILVAKDSVGVSGVKSYVYDTSMTQKNEIITFDLQIPAPVGLEVIEYPNKYVYCEGDTISYDGILVYAKYPDNSEVDVTSSVTFSPAAGKAFNSKTDSAVTVTYGRVETTFNFSACSIQVTNLPRTTYASGDIISYDGLVISENLYGINLDNTELCDISPVEGSKLSQNPTSVTVSCAPPLVPYASDIRYGNIYGQKWNYSSKDYSDYYTDVYRVQAGHTYKVVNWCYSGYVYAIFVTEDITKATSSVQGVDLPSKRLEAPSCVSEAYVPPSDGYILVYKGGQKGNTQTADYVSYQKTAGTYVCDLSAAKTQTTTFDIVLSTLYSIVVTTEPTKTEYAPNETLNYSGCIVTAYYENGEGVNITDLVTYSPAEGTEYDASMDSVTVSFASGGVTMKTNFDLFEATPTNLEITTPPLRTRYAKDDLITYEGISVTATYSTGVKVDVTSLVSYSTLEGTRFNPETDTDIIISYGSQTCNLSLTEGEPVLEKIAITTNPNKMDYRLRKETIDYSGIEVTGYYSDLTIADVTSICTFSPAQDAFEDYFASLSATISCMEQTCNLGFNRILPIFDYVELYSLPKRITYSVGEQIDLSGLAVKVHYEDGSSVIIDDFWPRGYGSNSGYGIKDDYFKGGIAIDSEADNTYYPTEATYFDPDYHRNIYITYMEKEADPGWPYCQGWSMYKRISFKLKLSAIDYIYVSTPPTKTAYSTGETISYSGLVVKAHYCDGTDKTISPIRQKSTEHVTEGYVIGSEGYTISPREGVEFDPKTSKNVKISYVSSDGNASCTLNLNERTTSGMNLKVAKLPDNITYKAGETLNYTGVIVKACITDGTHSEIDVTDFCEFTPAFGTTIPNTNPTTVVVKCPPIQQPSTYNYNIGYVRGSTWTQENPSQYVSDIYAVKSGHNYFLSLGATVGSKFAAMFTTTDVTSTTQPTVSGTGIIDTANHSPYSNATFKAPSDGYIIITKDQFSTLNLKTYLFAEDASKTETTTFDVGQVGSIASGMTLKAVYDKEVVFEEGDRLSYKAYEIRGVASDGTQSEIALRTSETSEMKGLLTYKPAEHTEAQLGMEKVIVECNENILPFIFDFNTGYVDQWGDWHAEVSKTYYSDVYRVLAKHKYVLYAGKNTLNITQDRVFFTEQDVRQVNAQIDIRYIVHLDPIEIDNNGYLIVTKTNKGISKLTTYLFDLGVS